MGFLDPIIPHVKRVDDNFAAVLDRLDRISRKIEDFSIEQTIHDPLWRPTLAVAGASTRLVGSPNMNQLWLIEYFNNDTPTAYTVDLTIGDPAAGGQKIFTWVATTAAYMPWVAAPLVVFPSEELWINNRIDVDANITLQILAKDISPRPAQFKDGSSGIVSTGIGPMHEPERDDIPPQTASPPAALHSDGHLPPT